MNGRFRRPQFICFYIATTLMLDEEQKTAEKRSLQQVTKFQIPPIYVRHSKIEGCNQEQHDVYNAVRYTHPE